MLKIGLTGSIAVGKSFVANVFAELGAKVLDADETARQVVASGSEGLSKLVGEFGAEILQSNGELDRAKLGAIVFHDTTKRERLNSILHPLIIAAQDLWINSIYRTDKNSVAIIDAALMIESGSFTRFDKIVVVWCADEIQVERLMKRNELTRAEAEKRIAAQLSQTEKKKYADFLIDTSYGFDDTRRQTAEIYKKILLLKG